MATRVKEKATEAIDVSAQFGFESKNPQDFILGTTDLNRTTERRIVRILVNVETVENISVRRVFTTKDGKKYFQLGNVNVYGKNKENSVKKYAEILDFLFANRKHCPIDISFINVPSINFSDSFIADHTITKIEQGIIHLKDSATLEEADNIAYKEEFIEYAWTQCKHVDIENMETVDRENFVCTLFIAFVCLPIVPNFSLNYMHNSQCYTKNSPVDVVKVAQGLHGGSKFYFSADIAKSVLYSSIVDESRLEKIHKIVGSNFHVLGFLGRKPKYLEHVKENIDSVCEFLDTYQKVTNIHFSESTDKDFGRSFPDFIRSAFPLINKDNKTLVCKSVIFDSWLTSVNFPKDRYYSPPKSVAYYRKCKQDVSYDRLALLYSEDFVNFADIVDGENSNVIYSAVFGKDWRGKGIFDNEEQQKIFLRNNKVHAICVLFLIKKANEFYNLGITEQEFIAMSQKFIRDTVKFYERNLECRIFFDNALENIIKVFLSFLIRTIDSKKAILAFVDTFGDMCEILEENVDDKLSFGSSVEGIKVKDIVSLLDLIFADVNGSNIIFSKTITLKMYVDIMNQ